MNNLMICDSLNNVTPVSDVQQEILEIYKWIRSVCEKHGLRYFAVGGTAIGAVRHKGFIPWDDDMDIAMPLRDYQEFLRVADSEMPQNIRTYICSTHAKNICLFDKVHNTETTYVEQRELDSPDDYKGIYVDIMPLCGLPENPFRRNLYAQHIRFLVRINRQRHQSYKENKKWTSKGLWLLSRPFDLIIPLEHWKKRWARLITRYDYDASPYIGFAWTPRLNDTRIYRKEVFGDGVELPFEDTVMRCPAEYDVMLKKVFGDYMTMPPEKDQKVHTHGIVSTGKSYRTFAEEKKHA